MLRSMDGSLSQLSGLKPGGHELRREVVVHHQRERILAATVDLVAERGYRAVTVAQIVKGAGVSRLKFYENFGSKEDAFLAAFDAGLAELGAKTAAACEAAEDDLGARVRAGIEALLAQLAAKPALTRALVIEAPVLGPAMGSRKEDALAAFAPLLAGARRSKAAAKLPAGTEEGVLIGLYWLLYDALLSGEPKSVTELDGALVEFALLPFTGPAPS